jgi:hypothetical protein
MPPSRMAWLGIYGCYLAAILVSWDGARSLDEGLTEPVLGLFQGIGVGDSRPLSL